jgi:hypothetical protein
MGVWSTALVFAASAVAQIRKQRGRPPAHSDAPGWARWIGEPRSAVFLVLVSALLIGGTRKLLHLWRARGAIGRLGDSDVTPAEIEAAAQFGRAGLMDLFRILGTAPDAESRDAAGRALATLWAQDNLIAEEEKALIRRGFVVTWRARRRYPRRLVSEVPIEVSYGVPFLREGSGVRHEHLEWSHRILGARRAGLEACTPWNAGPARAKFTIVPADFDTSSPNRLVLQARVRTVGLTDPWELDLPHMPFHFEFDPNLAPESLCTMPDQQRAEVMAHSVSLVSCETDESRPAEYLELTRDLVLREPPVLAVSTPLPCDLAHAIAVEFEGVEGRFPAGSLVLSGQGEGVAAPMATRSCSLGAICDLPADAIERPGPKRLRAILIADPDRGWADPDVRSIWPGTIETGWVDVQVVRR